MINLTKLYCGQDSGSDSLRYGEGNGAPKSAGSRRPIVVWTLSRRCNLHCAHCYTDSEDRPYAGELTVEEAQAMLDDLAGFKIPALLLSGGEPLYHPHIFKLAEYAAQKGLKLTLSTNGTLIDEAAAQRIKSIGFRYVGISFDGLGRVNDLFRGKRGAFAAALAGLRHLKTAGQRVGLRFTLTRRNYEALPDIFNFAEEEGIDRVCFYHLVYSGRGSRLVHDDLSHLETRWALNAILGWVKRLKEKNQAIEVLTVDNHADGPYVYLKLLEKDSTLAEAARKNLQWNGGGANSSGVGIANIDAQGNVHPDQFWQTHTLGNVRQRPFSEIWADESDPILAGLRNRLPLLKGRCATCRWKPLCGGSFRVRALQATGDPWAADPACYLADSEIAG